MVSFRSAADEPKLAVLAVNDEIIDDLRIKSCCAPLRLHQRAFRGAELLIKLHLRVGFVSPDGLPCRQPQVWRDAFSQVLAPEETA